MLEPESIKAIATHLGVTLPTNDFALNKKILIERINELIQTDFQKLVSILYRLDVSEKKLKNLLQQEPGTDAATLITELIIERQIEKIKSRQQYSKPAEDIDENEKW